MNRNGLDGHACILRLICEAAQSPLGIVNGVLGDLMHIILTWVFWKVFLQFVVDSNNFHFYRSQSILFAIWAPTGRLLRSGNHRHYAALWCVPTQLPTKRNGFDKHFLNESINDKNLFVLLYFSFLRELWVMSNDKRPIPLLVAPQRWLHTRHTLINRTNYPDNCAATSYNNWHTAHTLSIVQTIWSRVTLNESTL